LERGKQNEVCISHKYNKSKKVFTGYKHKRLNNK